MSVDRNTTATHSAWFPRLSDRVRWVWGFWRPHRHFVWILVLLTLVSSGVAIAYPLVFRYVIDRLSESLGAGSAVEPHILRNLLLILGAIALGRFVARLYPAFRAWVNLRLDVAIRHKVFTSVLEKDHRFFHVFRTGDLVTRLMDDITEYPKLAWFSCSGIFRALESTSKLVFCVGAMLLLEWRLTLIAVLPLPVMLMIIYTLRARQREAYEDQQISISRTNDMLEATFSGIRIVKAFCAERHQSRALDRILDERVGRQFRVQMLYALVHVLDTVASRLGQLVVIGVGGWMVARGELTLGSLYAIYVYLDMLVEPMIDLPNLFVTARQAFVCMDREEEVLRFPAPAAGANPARAQAAAAPADPLLVRLRNVTFTYETGTDPALAEVDLEIRRGERLAIVGEVASGKSTLLKLLVGLVQPESGVMEIEGADARSVDWEAFRRRIGYAPQESLLFSETILENVRMGRPAEQGNGEADPTVERMLKLVHIDEEVERMPAGVATTLGQRGTRVSGGQRQRLAIARALYTGPDLVLLDDCTASLDAENEDRLWAGLASWLPETTVVVVSHRLATIRRATKIAVLEGGRLAAVGSHPELLRSCPSYARFLEREEERERIEEGPRDRAGGHVGGVA